MTTSIDHRLDSQNHPDFQLQALASRPIIRHLRLLVKSSSYPVTNELPYHAKTVAFNIILDSVSNVEDPVSLTALLDSPGQTLSSDIEQLLDLGLHQADRHGSRGIPIPALINHAKVETDNVAIFQDPFGRRNAMNYFIVHGNANTSGKPVVALESRLCAELFNPLFGELIDLAGAHPWLGHLDHLLEDLSHNSA